MQVPQQKFGILKNATKQGLDLFGYSPMHFASEGGLWSNEDCTMTTDDLSEEEKKEQ